MYMLLRPYLSLIPFIKFDTYCSLLVFWWRLKIAFEACLSLILAGYSSTSFYSQAWTWMEWSRNETIQRIWGKSEGAEWRKGKAQKGKLKWEKEWLCSQYSWPKLSNFSQDLLLKWILTNRTNEEQMKNEDHAAYYISCSLDSKKGSLYS